MQIFVNDFLMAGMGHHKSMASTSDNLEDLVGWLLDGLADFDPADPVFFDPPGLLSLDQSPQAVELPWSLSLYQREGRVLDVGQAEPWYEAAFRHLGAAEWLALNPQSASTWLQLSQLPMPAQRFDLITCLSSLGPLGHYWGEFWAMGELFRLLAPTGRLLLSLPLGVGFYTQNQWLRLLLSQPFEIKSLRYFCYSEGWLECYPDLAYAPWTGRPGGLGCVELYKPAPGLN